MEIVKPIKAITAKPKAIFMKQNCCSSSIQQATL